MSETKEITKNLTELSKKHSPGQWRPESYIGRESSLTYLNLKVPHIRKAIQRDFRFSDQSTSEQWKIWDQVWNQSNIFEVMLTATFFANSRPVEELFQHRKKLIRWQKRVDNWAHSDELSNVYAKLLEFDSSAMMPIFKKWNQSKNNWDIRQSMVGLFFYSRFRKHVQPFNTVVEFLEPHLQSNHYYVQKAVGWTLRECWNVYPKETYRFLQAHAQQIPSGGWTAATEKLSSKQKTALKNIRSRR